MTVLPLFIGARSTKMFWKFRHEPLRNMCWMESIHVFTKKSFGVLRDFLITIALSHDYSLQISQCDPLWVVSLTLIFICLVF